MMIQSDEYFVQRGRYANQKMYETVFDGINDG